MEKRFLERRSTIQATFANYVELKNEMLSQNPFDKFRIVDLSFNAGTGELYVMTVEDITDVPGRPKKSFEPGVGSSKN